MNWTTIVFVPSRGFLFFYKSHAKAWLFLIEFSSPHGDFSFSIASFVAVILAVTVFVPSRGFLFFYVDEPIHSDA